MMIKTILPLLFLTTALSGCQTTNIQNIKPVSEIKIEQTEQLIQKEQIIQTEQINQNQQIEDIIEKAQEKGNKQTLQQILKQDLSNGNFKRDTLSNGVLIYQYNIDKIYGATLKFVDNNQENKVIATINYSYNPNKENENKCAIQIREVGGNNRGLYFSCRIDSDKRVVRENLINTLNINFKDQSKINRFWIENYSLYEMLIIQANTQIDSEKINWKYE